MLTILTVSENDQFMPRIHPVSEETGSFSSVQESS